MKDEIMEANGNVLYREEQRLRQWWIWLIVLLVAGFGWWGFVEQILLGRPFGDRPAPDWVVWIVFVLFGVLTPLVLYLGRLIVILVRDEVRLHWCLFGRRIVSLGEIESCRARQYRPLLEYGGWGIRWAGKRGWVWNATGNQGVQLELKGGKRLLIGSQRAEELAEAIRRAAGLSPP